MQIKLNATFYILGILKKPAEPKSDDDEEDAAKKAKLKIGEDPTEKEDVPEGPQMTTLSGPVLDPTFLGRGDASAFNKLAFMKSKKKVILDFM